MSFANMSVGTFCWIFWVIFVVCPIKIMGNGDTWCFKMNRKNQRAPAVSQIESVVAESVNNCIIKCGRKFPDCISVSYNDQTKECILQRTFSDDQAALPVDAPGFEFLDMKDPFNVCLSETPCKGGGICSDYFGYNFTCNCTSEIYAGSQNCTEIGQVLLIGGFSTNKNMEIYSVDEPINNKILNTFLDQSRYAHVAGLFDNGIVAIAGGSKGGFTSDTDLYDTNLNQIITGPPMSQIRYLPAAAMFNNEMFVCGGHQPPLLNSCEKLFFNLSTSQFEWKPISSMNSARRGARMVEVNSKLFVMGGHGSNSLNKVERYEPATDTWINVAPMLAVRTRFGAASLNDQIYVCGGTQNFNPAIRACEKYDTMTDTWNSIAPMNTARIGHIMISLNGKIYAFGGVAPAVAGTPMNLVEAYDPVTNTWTSVVDMQTPRGYQAAVVIK